MAIGVLARVIEIVETCMNECEVVEMGCVWEG